jgi:predicted hydrocarbon binding protein
MPNALRQELGDFNSIICFKAAILGMEEALGDKTCAIALTTAGRSRGKKLAEDLGLQNSSMPWDNLVSKLSLALGKEGTRLCIIEKIVSESEVVKVYTCETLCSAGEPSGSQRKCTFTMGVVWGVLEQILNKRLRGIHTESVLRGGTHDVFEFTPLD